MTEPNAKAQALLDFWFSTETKPFWFVKDAGFDQKVFDQMHALYEEAASGQLDHWKEDADSALALVLLLDQAPRNLFRNSPKSFATDAAACSLSKYILEQKYDQNWSKDQKVFAYLPLEHSENLADQALCLELIKQRVKDPDYVHYAQLHYDIIERFGRFPHRNAVLGRASTKEEQAFLKQPNSSF